jgi:phosphoglucomutase
MDEYCFEEDAAILRIDFILIIESNRSELGPMNDSLIALVDDLNGEGELHDEAAANLRVWLEGGFLSLASNEALKELLESGNAEELNNRFYKKIAFGTGGLRGRTIGATPTKGEKGDMDETGVPAFPAVGSNMLNEYTVIRATIGLFEFSRKHLETQGKGEIPKLVIAHDVRHFSRFFCELSASIWTTCGGKAFIFDGPRSTPHLSFAVRYLGATCGIVITASHNPPHDNGYKAYFTDGGQLVPPNDQSVIDEVENVSFDGLQKYLKIDLDKVSTLGPELDEAYVNAVVETVIDPGAFANSGLRVVFTPIHGTGAISTLPALDRLGVEPSLVESQMIQDSNFPTVKSPNPENAEALSLATALSEEIGVDILLATDPDCDRMGVAAADSDGKMILVTGNQIGAMLADYRIRKLKKMGWIPEGGTESAALIKTFVTSPLQDAIAKGHGIKCINTLTGFKWIGEKLHLYEQAATLAHKLETGEELDYDSLSQKERSKLLQKHSTFYVFGGEESYGYLPTDAVRDKDGNAASVIFCELAASLKKEGSTILEYLDSLYLQHGYFLETLGQIVYEGAAGAAKIARILETYRSSPPKEFLGSKVERFIDFGRETVNDPDRKEIPKQDLYFIELENGYRYAVRGSGTEPKIKFYLFGNDAVAEKSELKATKAKTKAALESLKQAVLYDAKNRAES